MALVPNVFQKAVFDAGPTPVDLTEGLGSTAIESGYYRNPSRPEEEILIERTKTVTNQYGTEIRRDEEEWQYDVAGGPPLRYDHRIYASTYLPGIGRGLRLVQVETTYFWCFSPLTDRDNLGRTKVVSAYVVYDKPKDPTKGLSGDELAAVIAKGYQGGTFQDRIISSGKIWSQANADSAVVENTSTTQATVWIEGVTVEHNEVEEEFDKWTVWNTKKDALRAGGVEVSGPEYIRKESYRYQLPVPLEPPTIAASARSDGIEIEIEGGGAEIHNSWFGPAGTFYVAPTEYYVYRKIVSEPDRSAGDNNYGWWETPPAAPSTRRILTNTDVTDFAGAPADPLPAQTSYTEPHDADPEPQPTEAEFVRIAEVENVNGNTDKGFATFLDTDCEDTAEYEYYATAVYYTQESTDSNHETVTFSGSGGTRRHRIIDKEEVVDAIAETDPIYPEEDFGEVIEVDLPAEDPVEVAEEVADRQFAMNRAADFEIRLVVLFPLLGLEWGQKMSIPSVSWETYGNALHLSTEVDNDVWMMTGFSRTIRRSQDGSWGSPETVLTLRERPRPQ
jgi:hypothetical protein